MAEGDGYLRLAAKFGRGDLGAKTASYHPLTCHMADVAAVALALWDSSLPNDTKDLINRGFGLADASTRQWVAFIAGCHDFGKATRAFQAKDPNYEHRLEGSGLVARRQEDPGHGLRTAALLPECVRGMGVPHAAATQMAVVTGAHHGRFHAGDARQASPVALDEARSEVGATWRGARARLFEDFRRLFDLNQVPVSSLPPPAAMLLAGLISVADWIGSIEERFEWSVGGAHDPRAYFEGAQRVAREVLGELEWPVTRPEQASSLRDLFGYLDTSERPFEPRPLQQRVQELAARLDSPSLVVVEAPMGEGKTEAALYLAHRWEAAGARGSYFALPTQAPANQMHRRVGEFLASRHSGDHVNLVLAHGGAWLEPGHLPSNVHGDEGVSATVAVGEWFLPLKRALLAPYGVGTIDQALLAVLQVRHVFVRLFGLAGKPVVVDEVHAYDTYMTGLLERLLEWLAALRSPVVLLSATLPSVRRQRLADAYARGLGGQAAPVAASPYPRLMWVGGAGSGEEGFAVSERSVRNLELRPVGSRETALVTELREALAAGGCAAVVCNTVGRAQELYRALREEFRPREELGLFHARFRAKDRRAIEAECLARFGKDGARRPRRYVLVATQVIEQSLDVDFDVMVSELAPVDLLLQRSGRLQRHERGERAVGGPALRVIWPETDSEGLPKFDAGTRAVYDEHILLRTWHALKNRDAIGIPGDVQRLVDLVYDEDEAVPADAWPALTAQWRETWAAMREKQRQEEDEAQLRRLGSPISTRSIERYLLDPKEEDEDLHPALQALTRLSDPSFNIVLLEPGEAVPLSLRGETVRGLLDQSVSVSHRRLVARLREMEPPPAFQRHAALRRHRVVSLDTGGVATVGSMQVHYADDVGLSIDQPEES